MKTKSVIIYSGGMDSYTLLMHELLVNNKDLSALSFNYGQKHKKELTFAEAVCSEHSIPHQTADITGVNHLLISALTGEKDVPEGHYADESMRDTVVPNRNMIMLSIAAGYAISIGAEEVLYAAHSGDHAIYPDCRPEFVKEIHKVLQVANYEPINVLAPFLGKDKGDIAIIGRDLDLDYSNTWTCYKGEEKHCGKCGACVERLEAFEKAGIPDPVEYVS